MPASRVCSTPGCPTLVAKSGPCPEHTKTTAQRGYDHRHKKASLQARASMPQGQPCSRCGQPMRRDEPRHLDHDDADRSRYRGLSHASCNTSAAGRASHDRH